MPETNQSLGVRDLRAIIHGLKMAGFSDIAEEQIREQISFLIEDLPSPETLDTMGASTEGLDGIREQVGAIMRLVELGSKQDEGFKVRYEAKKDMPPRYKVLKWRSTVSYNDLTKSLIKMSVFADDHNVPVVAEKAIQLAKIRSPKSNKGRGGFWN